MKNITRILSATVFFLATGNGLTVAEEIASAKDDNKMEAIQKMFASPYQEEDYYRTDRLLLTATGSLKPVHLAPSVASVITKEDIEAIGATTLDEALETVPGLHVFPNGLNIMEPNWSIRGIQTGLNPQVLLLINGVPLTLTLNGNRPFAFRMPVSMISRIEVVRGPGSAVHGADAFAGTVNVITKDGQEVDGTRAGIRYGSFSTSDIWLQHGGNYRGWDLAVGIDWQKSSGDNNRIIDQDGLSSGLPSMAPGPLDSRNEALSTYLALRKGHWTLHSHNSISESGMGHSGVQILSEESHKNSSFFTADLTYQHDNILPEWDLTLQGHTAYLEGYNHFDFYPDTFGVNAFGKPMYTEWNSGLEAVAFYSGFSEHRLRLAAGGDVKDMDSDQFKNFGAGIPPADWFGAMVNINNTPYVYIEDQNRANWHLSLQDEWVLARHWELTAGVRHDHYSDFGATTNPRAALVWEARPDLTAKLMYGRAFRAPSFGEQYFQNNSVTIGNPAIEPEIINTYELALDYQPTSRLHTVVSLFTYEIDGLIEYVADPAPATTFTAQNYKNQQGRGIELEAEWQTTDTLTLKGNVAYQRSTDKDTDEVVPEAPELQLYGNAHWQFRPEWSLDGQYFWIGGRHRDAADTRPDINDYDMVNLTLRRKNIAKRWEMALAVRNLFDEDAREPSPVPGTIPNDYPMASRALWGELRCNF